MKRILGRRSFLKGAAVATVGGRFAVSTAAGASAGPRVSPSDQIVVGFIGMGRQGIPNMRNFLELPDVRAGGVCDVYEPHLEAAAAASGSEKFTDFRKMLERPDIDAVAIASPDHWHPLMTILACQAGKDVYVEKPISVVVEEGRRMIQVASQTGRIVQVGTQQRSGLHFQKAVELIRAGELGRITSVRTWNFGNSFPEGIGSPADEDPPSELHWDLWLGPAPRRPFNANRFGVAPNRWSTFRYFWDYAGGMMTDWGAHHLDIVQWAMDVKGPRSIVASGGKLGAHDNRETPDTLTVVFEYGDFICTYENRDCNGRGINDRGGAVEFYGTDGTLAIDRSGFEVIPETRAVRDRRVPRMYSLKQENVNPHHPDHIRNFVECVKTRALPQSDLEGGHYSASVCHLGNIAYRVGRKIHWDPENERIIGDAEASRLLGREYRTPWSLSS